jgi:hypothetical protein
MVDKATGLICDHSVALTVFCSKQGYAKALRRIRYRDPDTGKRVVFLTNHFDLPAFTICKLYRLQNRAARAEDVCDTGCRAHGYLRLHRALLQPNQAALHAGLLEPGGLRTTSAGSLGACPRNRGQLGTTPRDIAHLQEKKLALPHLLDNTGS